MIGGEVAVRDPEIPLQLDGIACRQRHHGLQPDGGGERDVGGGNFAEGAADFRRAVQDEPSAHAGRGAGVDLVEQRRAEEVCAGDRRDEAVVASVERALIVIVGVVDADLRPAVDADVVVVVGEALEARQPGLIDDAGGVVDDQPVEEGAAVGGDRQPEPVRTEEAHQRLGDIGGLEGEPEVAARGFLVHCIEQIAGPALGDGLRGPERRIELGGERVGRVGGGANAKQRHVL
ncbi:hypothetical protein SAMN04489859_101613 [Paracoccus alcaliphilus]|uniref:Uncharacterized protein n=1 Tax=Paracoccus alcaliphilus TaxID=34002 RepID=A0A1H8J850_9RHOB|nr:hypothetical protein SAMN04489859_101613 [Paracoccus alcaliphilus]